MSEKLLNLISNLVSENNILQEIINEESLLSIKSCSISTKQALDVYKGRAKSLSALSGLIDGFDKLIDNLEKLEDNSVSIHRLSTNQVRLLIFTNITCTQTFGILIFDKSLWKEQ